MKKLAILSPLVILMASTSLAQDSCITRPSCADMGYTKTEADCTGKTTLKCPFDLSKVSCEDDTQTTDNKLIDYDGWISCSSLSYVERYNKYGDHLYFFIAPDDGCFFGVSAMETEFFRVSVSGFHCVKKGDMLYSNSVCYFIPYVGSGKIKSASNCEKRDFYFSDNTCSSTSHVGKTKVGIVIDTSKRLLLSPSLYYKVKDVNWSEAVDYCNNMTRGNKSWYLPSSAELKTYTSTLNDLFENRFYFWSSTISASNNSEAFVCSEDGCHVEYKYSLFNDSNDPNYSAICFANY